MVPCYTIKRAFLPCKKTNEIIYSLLACRLSPQSGKGAEVFYESSNCLMNILSDSKQGMGALIKL